MAFAGGCFRLVIYNTLSLSRITFDCVTQVHVTLRTDIGWVTHTVWRAIRYLTVTISSTAVSFTFVFLTVGPHVIRVASKTCPIVSSFRASMTEKLLNVVRKEIGLPNLFDTVDPRVSHSNTFFTCHIDRDKIPKSDVENQGPPFPNRKLDSGCQSEIDP